MAVLAWLRKIQHALHECAESIRRAEEHKRKLKMPSDDPVEVRAVVSFDKEFVRDSAAQDERNHAIQNSIKNATWAGFGAVTAYAIITTLMWWAMRDQTKLLTHQVKDATTGLHLAYRPQVFIDSITGAGVESEGEHRGEYRIAWDGTNYGNTVAHDLRVFMFYELTPARESAVKQPYQEIRDQERVVAPSKNGGRTFFIPLTPAERQEVTNGDFITVSVRVEYEGNFPNISYYAERCTSFKTSGPNNHSALDNAPCQWPVENGWKEEQKAN
jgi:hypothetical protein